jgi:hypothetical protein
MPSTFLSDPWFAAVEHLRDEMPPVPDGAQDVILNIVVTGGPDGDREVHFTGGQFERGLLDGAPTKIKVPFDVAKAMFVEGNQAAAMQAFMAGKIQIEGDMTKLMALQSQAGSMINPTPEQLDFYQRVRALTA